MHRRRRHEKNNLADFYILLAIFLFSHYIGMRQYSCITLFGKFVFITPSTRYTSKVGNKLIPFHPTLRVTETSGTWRWQRDATQLLNYFERRAWSVSKRLFYVPLVQFITLEDELIGTRSRYVQVKCYRTENRTGRGNLLILLYTHCFVSLLRVGSKEGESLT